MAMVGRKWTVPGKFGCAPRLGMRRVWQDAPNYSTKIHQSGPVYEYAGCGIVLNCGGCCFSAILVGDGILRVVRIVVVCLFPSVYSSRLLCLL